MLVATLQTESPSTVTLARRFIWLLVVLGVLGVLGAPWALAQNRAALDGKALAAIRADMEKGQGLFVAKDFAAAAAVFEQGFQRHQYPAFLFNAGVCYEKLARPKDAADKLRAYLAADPAAADATAVRERIQKLEAAVQSVTALPDAGAEEAGDADADAAPPVPPAPTMPTDLPPTDTKSLVIVETEPAGAPVRLYKKTVERAPKFALGGANAGWTEVASRPSPLSLSVDVGDYHLVVAKYRDLNPTDTEIRVEAGRVFHFRANLSQGKFMGFLRVTANVEGARVHLNDPAKKQPVWGRTPHGELVPRGDHTILVEAPGYDPLTRKVRVEQAEQVELQVELVRERFGTLRVTANAPEIRVEIAGKPVGVWKQGEVPLERRLPSGKTLVTIRADGYKTYEGDLTIPRGQVLPLEAELIPKYPRGAAWTQAIIGAVFLGAGTYLGIKSNQLYDEIEADRRAGVLASDDERISRGRLFAIGADAGFAVGGVLALLATYNFIRDPLPDSGVRPGQLEEPPGPAGRKPAQATLRARQRSTRRLDVTPMMGAEFGGIGIGGTF